MKTAIGIGGGAGAIVAQVIIQVCAATGHPLTDEAQGLLTEAALGIAGLCSLAYAWYQHRQTKTALGDAVDAKNHAEAKLGFAKADIAKLQAVQPPSKPVQ